MRKNIKAILVLCCIMALVLTGIGIPAASAATTVDSLTVSNLLGSLGEATQYGVVAREWDQGGHSETNACVDVLDRHTNTVFSNTGSTYFHALGYRLDAEVTAPQSMNGMTFALFKESEDGSGLVLIDGSQITLNADVTTATLSWDIDGMSREALKDLKNTRLYVRQVNTDGTYVDEGGTNEANLVVNYGPSISASAYNSNYIGKIYYSDGVPDSVGIFNTTGNTPGIVLGAATRLYYQNSAGEYVQFDPEDTTISTQYVMVNVYYGDPEQMTYAKLDGISVKDGVFTKNGNVIKISYSDETSRAADLLEDAEAYSKYLANIGGGEITSLTPNPEGSSTVHGPVTEDGHVLSLYDVEVGSDGVFKVQDDMGWAGIPVAPNEYVVINLICPSKDGEVLVGPGAADVTYFFEEGQGTGEGVQWGTEDSNSSQRVIFNFVYADENGVMQPFEGTIVPHSRHGGTLLAPKAKVSVTGEVHNGAIIADNVYNGQETHQRSLAAGTRTTWVVMNGGYLTLEKVSVEMGYGYINEGGPLEGAVFGVYSDEDCTQLVAEITTDENGKATSPLVTAGTYYVKEIKAPDGYSMPTDYWGNVNNPVVSVTVTPGQTTKVDGPGYQWGYQTIADGKFVNQVSYTQYGDLRVEKIVSDNGAPLQGATFGIYTREQTGGGPRPQYTYTLVGTMTTNRNGVAVYEHLAINTDWYGNTYPYYVKEISAPEGYNITNKDYVEVYLEADQMVTVDGNGNADGKAFQNAIIRGNMALKKVDAKTNANLEGAEFTIYSDAACTQVVGVMTTKKGGDADSKAVIAGKNGLIPGTYYVKETKAPDGYLMPENPAVYTVTVVADKVTDVATGSFITGAPEATAITNDQAIHLYGTKVWYDEGYENNRPNEVKVELYRGTQFLREATVKAPDWKFEFLNLPRYDSDGNEIEYSVRENLSGKSYDYYAYVDGIDGSGNVSIVVANSIRRVEITGEKAWEDGLDYDPSRPDSITYLLYQQVDGELVPMLNDQDQHMSYTGGSWESYKFKFENLPFYDANGDVATYVVQEAESDEYLLIDSAVTETEDQNKVKLHFTLTNRMVVSLEGAKVWQDSSDYQGKRPENVTLVVYCNGERMRPQPTITWDKTTDTDVWTWKVEDLRKYDEDGNAYTYTVRENEVRDYTSTVSEDGLTFYNTIYGNIQLYKRNDTNTTHLNGAQFKLYYDAACQNPVFGDQVFETASRNNRDGWLIIENVVPGDYYILEVKAPLGYALPNPNNPIPVTVVAGVNDNRVNSHLDPSDLSYRVVLNAKEGEDTTIEVNKTWVGDEGKEDARPQSVTIQLYQNDQPMDGKTLELTADNNWSGEFTKLPSVDANDASYVYTVKETAVVPGYVGTVAGSVEDGFTVINTYNQTEITVTKQWEGPVSADDMGPVEVRLLANGTPVDGMTAQLSKDNSWTAIFDSLPIADENGNEIAYTVEETTVLADFAITYTGDKTTGFVVTNTAKVGKITLTKVDAESGKVLSGARFAIYKDAECQDWVADLVTGNDGTATSGDLLPGTYYVKETEAPSGYRLPETEAVAVTVVADQTVQAIGDGTDGAFTNEQGKGKLYLKKVGTDSSNNNAQPLKGAEFTVYQYINGQKTEVGKIITDENGYGEIALPMGSYMVQETKAPEGYKINDNTEKWVNIERVDQEVQVQGGFNYNNEYGWFQNTSTATGSIKLTKVSAADANTKLAGAVFGVYSDENCQTKVGEMTTDANGEATYANLEANRTFYVKEITAPEGYELNTQVYSVLVAPNTETAVNNGTPIPNEAEREKGAISLVKVSAEDANTKLTGAVFGVYSDESCATKVGEMTTDANGAATLDGLFAGETYWVKEITAPSGYVLNDTVYSVTVVANTTTAVNEGNAITNDVSDGVASIYLYKVATDTSGTNVTGWLAGAEFDVYNVVNWSKGTRIGSMTTDANGYAEFTVPAIGNYIVVETKAPAGYERDYTERWVEVYNEGDKVQVKGDKTYNGTSGCIANKKQQIAYLELYKLGAEFDAEGNAIYSTLELLDGAEFTVTANDDSIDPIVIVTENGYAKVELPANMNLTITETKAPEGYEITQGASTGLWLQPDQNTTLSWWGTNLQSTNGNYIYYESSLANSGALINKKLVQYGGFKFTKQDDSGNALSGAVFGVYAEEACTTKLHELTSDANGVVALTDLTADTTYYIKEITAPTGYGLNETVYSVTIEADVDDKLVGDNGVITNTLREAEATFAFNKWINHYGDGELTVLDFTFTIEPLGEYDDTMLAFKDGHPVDKAFTVTVKGDEAFVNIRTALDLTIWKAGTYEFKITENVDNVPDGWFFATDEIIVSIPVTEQDDGSLAVGDVLYDDLPMAKEFVNWYYGDTSFYANKVWTNYNGEESISLKLYYRLSQGADENGESIYGPWMEYTDDYEIDLTKDEAELGEESAWEINIENLPVCIDNKNAEYGVAEVGIDGDYVVTYEDVSGDLITEDSNGLRVVPYGGIITNTLNTIDLRVAKNWHTTDGDIDNANLSQDVTDALRLYILASDGTETLVEDAGGAALKPVREEGTENDPDLYWWRGLEILPEGSQYIVKETEAPAGFVVDYNNEGNAYVSFPEDSYDGYGGFGVLYNNAFRGSAVFVAEKTVDGQHVDASFEFELLNSSGEVVTTADSAYGEDLLNPGEKRNKVVLTVEYDADDQPTTADGVTVYEYTLREVAGDGAYVYDTTNYRFKVTIDRAGNVNQYIWVDDDYQPYNPILNNLTFNNQTIGGIKIVKVDESNQPVAGVQFGIYFDAACTDVMAFVTTDENGVASRDVLVPGQTYYVKEISAPAGYVVDDTVYPVTIEAGVLDKLVGDNGVIVNKATKTSISGTKVWADADDALGMRPETITIWLYADDVKTDKSVTISSDETTWSFNDLPEYKDGQKIVYTADEADVPDGYVKTVTGDAASGFVITNTLETTEVAVTKVWEGGVNAGADLTDDLRLYVRTVNGEGQEVFTLVKDAVPTRSGEVYTWSNLPMYDEQGNRIAYVVMETKTPAGYTVAYQTLHVGEDEDQEVSKNFALNGETITNTYAAEGEITFAGMKTIEGRSLTADDVFTFEIKEGETVIATVENDANGKIAYPTIAYTQADVGVHIYTIRETSADANGVTVDTMVYTMTVTVDDNGDGTLTVTADIDHTALDFTNTYKAEGSIQLSGMKTLRGKDLAAGDFSFELLNEDGTVIETVTNDADGNFAFTAIEYNQEDTGSYIYTVQEVNDEQPGVTYDDMVYTMTVTVDDNGDGTLTVTADIDHTALDFTNTYKAEGSIQLSGMKTLRGKDLAAGDFSFELLNEDGTVIETVTNDADGNFAFTAIEYNQEDTGSYIYTVQEVNDGQPGVTYDDTVYTMTVTVDDNGDGTLTVTADIDHTALYFTNTYEASNSVTFAGTKTLEGRALTANDVFVFEVSENGTDKVWIVRSDATGTIAYPTITYTLDDLGTHTYTVQELSEDGNGITVDTNTYTVTVTVSDNGDGTLTVEASDNAKALDFTNTYEAEGKILFAGTKTLIGRETTIDDVFTFEIKEGDEVIAVAENGGDMICFPEIKYTLADVGTHTYTVCETSTSGNGITVDDTVYTVTVTVTDNGDGTLEIEASDNAAALDFINTYEAEGSVQFGGYKTLIGRELEEGEFTFELTDDEGNVLDTATNAVDGSYDFFTLYYDQDDIGTYLYYVREVNDGLPGVTYSDTIHTVSVDVSDNGDGTLEINTNCNVRMLDFVNNYEAKGEITFEGVKTIEGRELTADDVFTFEVKEGETVIATVENGATGAIAYPTIAYTLDDVGEHTYTVRETSTDGNGITVDTNTYTVTVTVSDNGDGTLKVEASDNAEALNFTNTYAAAGEIVLEGTKTLVGRELAAGEFSFELIDEAGDVVATATNDADGKITFTKLTYTTEDIGKTYTYEAHEIAGDQAGVTYDAAPITVKVAITDNGDGTLKVAETSESHKIAFTNTYSAEGAILLAGTKSLSGRELAAGEFSFELYDEAGNLLQTVQNDAKGAFAFEEIEYDLSDAGKTFTYTVKEKAGSLPGVTYDDAVITVEVEVKDVGGALTATLTQNSKAIAFTNTYEAAGSITFEGVKTIEGREMTEDDVFTFEVKEGNDVLALVMNDADGKIAYPTITYTLADVGEHTYTVRETNTDGDGMKVDATVYTVTVTVADTGDGELTVTASGNATKLNFTNTYAADGSVQFSGTKTLTGKTLAADDFSFELIDEAGNVIETVKNGADGAFSFTAIQYELSDIGEHTYTVKEVNDGKSGVTYDTTVYTVTVTVADTGDGELSVTASDNATKLNFTNTYAADGSVQFSGSKTLTGKELAADKFSFELIDEAGNVIETVKNGADGAFAFTAIKYELADIGEHTYTVKEVNDGKSGVTYDTTVYTVTVTVADAGDGSLTVTASDNATKLNFTNTYAADGSVQFMGSKTLTSKALAADEFSFELIDEAGNVIETVKNGADGAFAFTAIKYELADIGEHTYTVKEVNDGKSGVTYDTTVYTVTVTVADAGDGSLTVTASDNATKLNFTNTYAADGSVQFSGRKTLTGKELAADEFSFELIDGAGNVIETVKNGADGTFAFTAIKYELADIGEHTYTVKEVNDGKAGITYDETVYTVTVKVTDNGDGTLKVEASDNAAALDFTNAYGATGELLLSGTKTLTGKELEAGMFSFELLDADGNVLQTVQNAADGAFAFTAIPYTLADAGQSYTYKVREASGNSAGVIYDATVYTVKVDIADNGDGTLTVTPVITRLGQVVDTIAFNNIMEAPLTISKKVEGCVTDEKFVITVYFYHADGTEVTEPVSYTGDLTGELVSGGRLFLGHGQSITFTGLLPGMRYTVQEAANNAYETTINTLPMNRADGVCSVEGNRADFVNKLKTTTFSVTKRWDGDYGGAIILTLYGNGEKLDPQPEYTRDGDVYTYTGLPMYNADGDLVVYSAKEKYVDGYLTIYDNIPPYDGESGMIYDGGTIINRSVTSIRVRKLWDGLAEDAELPVITLTLYCNGEVMNRKQPKPDEDGWYVYKNLPRYVNGELAKYRVVEETMDGFVAIYTDPNGEPAEWAEDGYTITNQMMPATGDSTPLMLWAVMFTGSAALLMLMLKRRRKAN